MLNVAAAHVVPRRTGQRTAPAKWQPADAAKLRTQDEYGGSWAMAQFILATVTRWLFGEEKAIELDFAISSSKSALRSQSAVRHF
jgi:hypothetical protein